jgi:CIC family chloride channel protein
VTKPLDTIRRLPAVGVLAERQMGGFLAMSALVGVGVGLGAAGMVKLLDLVERAFADFDLDNGTAWLFLFIPVGFIVAWLIARHFAPEVAGDGVPEAKAALIVRGGRIRGRVAPLKMLATAATIGPGGSGGREGPIVQIGAAIGSWLSRRFNLGEDQVRSLVAAGAGAGIGASFNAPIAGMLFALEVILSSFAVRHMSAIVIASVTAAVTTRSIIGEELAIKAGTYDTPAFADLILYGLMALVVVLIGLIFLRGLDKLEEWVHPRARKLGVFRPLGAGLLVAGLIFIEPQLFGTGQEVTNSLLLGEKLSAVTGEPQELWWVFILLALGKAAATALTISSGGSGGAFMPSLFMGAAVGTGFGWAVQPFWGNPIQPGAFAVVGMAAMFAVVARAPLTSILIVFEVTGAEDYQLILPLMLAATLGTFLAERFSKDSVYTMALRRKGVSIRSTGEVDVLDTISVKEVMSSPGFVADVSDSTADIDRLMNKYRYHGIPVQDEGRLVGIVTVSDIIRTGGPSEDMTVSAVMTRRPVTVVPSTRVSQALERMAALGVGRLPVVDEDEPARLVGVFRREDAVRAYHEALSATTDIELHKARLAQRTDPGAGYFDFRIPPGSMADERQVKEVAWPEGSTLVSVRRGREVLVPAGNTVLYSGDVVTAFGTESSKRSVIERLNQGADEPTAEITLADIEAEGETDPEAPTL